MARYWWGSFQSKRKIHWKAWKKINIPKRKGGLGFRKFVPYNQALLAKQAWRLLMNPNSLIARFLKAKYFTKTNLLEAREGKAPSLSWRSIAWGKTLLVKGLRRRIGNRQDTKAFTDPWIPRPPSFLPLTQRPDDRKVSEFFQQPGLWNGDLVKQHFRSPDAHLIQSIPLNMFNHPDSWMWHYTKNGSYTVKSGYNLAEDMDASGPSSSSDVLSVWWNSYWANKAPRKILMFGWRGFHEILPTGKGLHHRNVLKHSNYLLCGFGEESNAHAVFWCPFAHELWALFEFPFLVGQKEDISFKDVLFYTSEFLEKDSFVKMLMATWSLWSERNRRTHDQPPRTPQQLKGWICSYHEEIKKAQNSEGEVTSRSVEPEIELNNFSLLVDAAISTTKNMVGLGAVIFTPNKRILATLSKPLQGLLSVLHAEALALIVGLRWTQNTGLPIKNILSYSLGLVSVIYNPNSYQNELGILTSDIKVLLTNFAGAKISHVRRKINVEAHKLAKQALQLNEEVSWMNGMSQSEHLST